MSPYFDTANADHVKLLPKGLRDHDDLANLAAAAEADTIGEYTKPEHNDDACVLDAGTAVERYVWLRGFDPDPSVAPASLGDALRREIAGVIRWRAARDAKKPGVTAEQAGDPATAKTYDAALERALPPDFGRCLSPFRITRVATVI